MTAQTDEDLARDMVGDVRSLDLTALARGADWTEPPRYDPADSGLRPLCWAFVAGCVAGFLMAVAVMP